VRRQHNPIPILLQLHAVEGPAGSYEAAAAKTISDRNADHEQIHTYVYLDLFKTGSADLAVI